MLVAIDGSKQSYKALDHAIYIAKKFDSKLTLLTIIPRTTIYPINEVGMPDITNIDLEDYKEGLKTRYQDILTEAWETIRSNHTDIDSKTILLKGRPSTNIVNFARATHLPIDRICVSWGCCQPWSKGGKTREQEPAWPDSIWYGDPPCNNYPTSRIPRLH